MPQRTGALQAWQTAHGCAQMLKAVWTPLEALASVQGFPQAPLKASFQVTPAENLGETGQFLKHTNSLRDCCLLFIHLSIFSRKRFFYYIFFQIIVFIDYMAFQIIYYIIRLYRLYIYIILHIICRLYYTIRLHIQIIYHILNMYYIFRLYYNQIIYYIIVFIDYMAFFRFTMLCQLQVYSPVIQLHTHTHTLLQVVFMYRLLQNIQCCSLCYAVGPCWLSILCMVGSVYLLIQSPDVSHPLPICFGNRKLVFYMSVGLLLFLKFVCIFFCLDSTYKRSHIYLSFCFQMS